MARCLRAICIGSLVAVLGACSGPSRQTCTPGVGSPVTVFTLYLGRAIPGRGEMTDLEWRSFLNDTVTANLPNGYTIMSADGAWMNPTTRTTIKEATKILVVALPDTPDSLAAVDRIRSAYKLRFHQQLVGMTVEPACATF